MDKGTLRDRVLRDSLLEKVEVEGWGTWAGNDQGY